MLEGSTLTLFGLVEFDFEQSELKMTQLYDVFEGGFSEYAKILDNYANIFYRKRLLFSFLAVLLLTRGINPIIKWYYDKKGNVNQKKEDQKWV